MSIRETEPIVGRRLATLTLLLGGLTAFGPLSMDLYLPAFPLLAADLHATQAQVQLTLTADVLGLVAGHLGLGAPSAAWWRGSSCSGRSPTPGVGAVCWSVPPSSVPSPRCCARWRPRRRCSPPGASSRGSPAAAASCSRGRSPRT